MKNQMNLLSYMLLLFVAFSCTENNDVELIDESTTENIVLTFGSKSDSGGRTEEDPLLSDVDHAIITITNEDGSTLENWNRREIPLHFISGKLLSVEYEFVEGNYSVTECILYDADGNDLFASPLEGSPLAVAQAVNDPLPINFSVTPTGVREVRIEIVSTIDEEAENFGYPITASFLIGNTFNFYFTTQINDPFQGRIVRTEAEVTVLTTAGDTIRNVNTEPRINRLLLGGGLDSYRVLASRRGYQTYDSVFNVAEMRDFVISTPLDIVLIRQPIPSDNIRGFFPLDGNTVNTVNGESSPLGNQPINFTSNRFNNANKAGSFRGDGIPNSPMEDIEQNYTIGFWVAVERPGNIIEVGENSTSSPSFFFRCLGVGTNSISFRFGVRRGNVINSDQFFDIYPNSISSEEWIHITIIKEENIHSIYINAEIVAQGELENYFNLNSTAFGRSNFGDGFLGELDDVLFYSRALTPDEVFTLFLR